MEFGKVEETKEQKAARIRGEMERIFYLSLLGTAIFGFISVILGIVVAQLFLTVDTKNQTQLLQLIAYLLALLVTSKFTKNLFLITSHASRNY